MNQATEFIQKYDEQRELFIQITERINDLELESEQIRSDIEEQAIEESATATGVASLKRKKLAGHDRYQAVQLEIARLKVDQMRAEKSARVAEMLAWSNMERIH